MSQKLLIFSDGGARGNPGPAAVAFIAQNERAEIVKADARYIGTHTNNQAEYEALLLALQFASEAGAREIVCHLDSELVVRQLNGEYNVKDSQLRQLWRKVQQFKTCFKKISFVNVPRSHPQTQRADALVNKALDEEAGKRERQNLPSSMVLEEPTNALFAHASIRTSNLERSIDFYSKFLGLKVQRRRIIKQTNAEIVFLSDPAGKGCLLELAFYHDQKKFVQADYEDRLFDHLGFEVADIGRTIAAMRAANVTITDEPSQLDEHTMIAFVEDPDGTLIELVERK